MADIVAAVGLALIAGVFWWLHPAAGVFVAGLGLIRIGWQIRVQERRREVERLRRMGQTEV